MLTGANTKSGTRQWIGTQQDLVILNGVKNDNYKLVAQALAVDCPEGYRTALDSLQTGWYYLYTF